MSPEILERVGESRCGTLRSRLTDLRKLVRVKIADDGDLKQARRAVTDIDAFCRLVKDIAGQKQVAAHDMLATLR